MNKEKENIKIWVLVDSRTGNANQAIELAQTLGIEFEVKNIEYNKLARLPSYFFSIFPIHVKKSIILQLEQSKMPDIVISAGRKTAALALHLKKKAKKTEHDIKIIQIMRPNIDPKEFDLIILPQHDSFNYTLPNIARVIGALTNINNKISKAEKDFENKYPEIGKFTAVLVGGDTKGYVMNLKDTKNFIQILNNITETLSMPLFITFSRRTPKKVKSYFKSVFLWPNVIYDPESNGYNPYPAILGKAEYIIATPDSISMCSEAASTGKPFYIFLSKRFKIKKHNFFIQQLMDLGIVRRLNANSVSLEKYNYKPLSEVTKVSNIIKQKLLCDHV